MKTKVAIVVSTMNRPEFMIRQLRYYENLDSPHTVYIGDSSTPDKAKILTDEIDKLSINVKYEWFPKGSDNTTKIMEKVREKYTCLLGDDDYQVPNSLTKCAEFLENNPDYASAGGKAITFRLKTSGAYGENKRWSPYPRISIEADTAVQRVRDFVKVIYSVTFHVNRVEHMKEAFKNHIVYGYSSTICELDSWCYCIASGKAKVLDCLTLVRQIHDQQYVLPTSFDWIVGEKFHSEYKLYEEHVGGIISKIDQISIEEAREIAKEVLWSYLQKVLTSDYNMLYLKD